MTKFRDYVSDNIELKLSGLTPDGDTVEITKVGYYIESEEEIKRDNRYKGWVECDIHVFDSNTDYHLYVSANFALDRIDDKFIVELSGEYQLLGAYTIEKHIKMTEIFDLITIYSNTVTFSVDDMLKAGVPEDEIEKYS